MSDRHAKTLVGRILLLLIQTAERRVKRRDNTKVHRKAQFYETQSSWLRKLIDRCESFFHVLLLTDLKAFNSSSPSLCSFYNSFPPVLCVCVLLLCCRSEATTREAINVQCMWPSWYKKWKRAFKWRNSVCLLLLVFLLGLLFATGTDSDWLTLPPDETGEGRIEINLFASRFKWKRDRGEERGGGWRLI